MNDFEKSMATQHGLVSKAGYQVLVAEEKFARQLAEKYGATIDKRDDGWLVQKQIPSKSDGDPIIAAIKAAIEALPRS